MIEITRFLIALQPTDVTEPATTGSSDALNWWTTTVIDEPTGFDLLLLLGGVIFFGLVFRGIYSAMLYNQVAANRHPANFRKVMISLWLLCGIIWFAWVFFHVFGGLILILLIAVWIALAVFFIITRRKVMLPQN